jgi:hypothetical protein
MRYYIIRIQVDFKKPREMPPLANSDKKWRSVGYFQTFYCTEKSKEKARQLVNDFFATNETDLNNCQFKIIHSVWLRGISKREQLISSAGKLTDVMFEKRDQIGIWFIGENEFYVSEYDAAASFYEEMNEEDL